MQNFPSRRTLNAKADCYTEHSFLQQEISKRLDERLSYIKIDPKIILDLGAATGFSTQLLKKRYPKSTIIACDEAENLLQQQTTSSWIPLKKDKKKFLLCANAKELSLADNSVDLVFSNLMLPWYHSEEDIFSEIFRVLKPGAALLLTSFGPDTFKELKKMNQEFGGPVSIPNFKDMHDIGDILLRRGFVDPVVDMEMLSVEYNNVDKLKNDLHHQNISLDSNIDLQSKKTLLLTYEIIYGHAWMPENKVKNNLSEYVISVDNIAKKNSSSS